MVFTYFIPLAYKSYPAHFEFNFLQPTLGRFQPSAYSLSSSTSWRRQTCSSIGQSWTTSRTRRSSCSSQSPPAPPPTARTRRRLRTATVCKRCRMISLQRRRRINEGGERGHPRLDIFTEHRIVYQRLWLKIRIFTMSP